MNLATRLINRHFPSLLQISILACAGLLAALNASAQGALTPPAGPQPTMKSLQQIYDKTDPRIAITNSSSTVSITVPGSYYLTTNLTVASGNAIQISTSGVTLDLNGFTISSTLSPASMAAIVLYNSLAEPVIRDVTIRNGHIRSGVTNDAAGNYSGVGFASGITYSSQTPTNIVVEEITVQGVSSVGIDLGRGNSCVRNCNVSGAGQFGIYASVITSSTAAGCKLNAIAGTLVSDCVGRSRNGNGVSGDVVRDSSGYSESGIGLSGGNVQNCFGQSGSSTGLSATTAFNSSGKSDGNGVGLLSEVANGCNGTSVSSTGMLVSKIATTCVGTSGSGTGLQSDMAVSCHGSSTSGTGLIALKANFCFGSSVGATVKYNMP